ncbi:glycosyltransferase [Rhodophyticola sp.]|jgi:glycosyltransferase involved in cell wall biosynthesis|uniref:glycosyltransferase n=1 Tax=Rhodophyticola sp. TaxID=2680032 RepID=UPI003D2D6674
MGFEKRGAANGPGTPKQGTAEFGAIGSAAVTRAREASRAREEARTPVSSVRSLPGATPAPTERQPPYSGNIDYFSAGKLHGWVVRTNARESRPMVGLFIGDRAVIRQLASKPRSDVKEAGIGDGYCGFELPVDDAAYALAKRFGYQVSVRVLDDPKFEIGTYTLPKPLFGGLDRNSPMIDHCRMLLSDELTLMAKLLARVDRPVTSPKLGKHALLFDKSRLIPESDAAPDTDTRLPAYLDYVKHRLHKDRSFDTDGTPEDRDHFLHWYLTGYGTIRRGLRTPLPHDAIEYLNAPFVIGGQKHALTRAMWWRIVDDGTKLKSLDLSDSAAFLDLLYWWAEKEAPRLSVEDCLVPARYADLLRMVPTARKDDAFPLSNFMVRLQEDRSSFQFLDPTEEEDRKLFSLCMVLCGASRPDLLRYVPAGSFRKIFARQGETPSIFETFYQAMTLQDDPVPISHERFAALIRLRGYDLQSHQFLARTETGDRLHAVALPIAADAETVDVQLIGPFEKASGLGQATRLSAEIMSRTGLRVNCVDFGLDNPAPEGFSKVGKMSDWKKARINLLHLNAESIPLAFAYGPDVFSDSYNIGYFYWELDTPALCHYLGMELLDEIWVSTEFGVSIYRPETTQPVVNVGMCFEELSPVDKDAARRNLVQQLHLPDDAFLCLVAFDSFSFVQRKNPLGVLAAFQKAFRGIDTAHLIIKTQNRDHVSDPMQERIWKRADAMIAADPRIHVINETLTYEALVDLKAASDCYISLHKSEGWGFGMIEAMNLKVPVVCTGYSGNMDFCSERTAWLVDYKDSYLVDGDYIFVRAGQKWADPDIDDAAAQLSALYRNPRERAAKVEAAFANVRQNFSADAIARRYEARLQEILKTL